MKSTSARILSLWALLAVTPIIVAAEAPPGLRDEIDLVRSTYRADRQAIVAEALQLTEREGDAFWPIYRRYRAEMEGVGDSLVKVVLEYADAYPDVPEDRAVRLLKEFTALEEKLVKQRSSYLKRARKALPAAKILRWAQIENRLDLALRLQLAGHIPLITPVPSQP